MINVGRYIDTGSGTHFHRRLIVNHLLTLSGNHVDDFFGARVVMPRVPFSLGEFNNTETEALCTGNNRFAEEVDFSPVKFHTINISRGGNNAGSKSLHRGKVIHLYPEKIRQTKQFLWVANRDGSLTSQHNMLSLLALKSKTRQSALKLLKLSSRFGIAQS